MKMQKGKYMEVHFFRVPNNQYDSKAIVVTNEEGNKLGYIPRNKNESIFKKLERNYYDLHYRRYTC